MPPATHGRSTIALLLLAALAGIGSLVGVGLSSLQPLAPGALGVPSVRQPAVVVLPPEVGQSREIAVPVAGPGAVGSRSRVPPTIVLLAGPSRSAGIRGSLGISSGQHSAGVRVVEPTQVASSIQSAAVVAAPAGAALRAGHPGPARKLPTVFPALPAPALLVAPGGTTAPGRVPARGPLARRRPPRSPPHGVQHRPAGRPRRPLPAPPGPPRPGPAAPAPSRPGPPGPRHH